MGLARDSLLEIEARDGAARLGEAAWDGRRMRIPALLWVESELGPGEARFEPRLSAPASPGAAIVATRGFQESTPTVSTGQLLLQRTLTPAPAMASGAVRLVDLAGRVAVLHGAYSLAKNPRRLAPALARARTEAGYRRLLYAPGLGEPNHLSLLAYAGVDLFDSVPLSLAAAEGRFLSADGSFPAASLRAPQCACPACEGGAPDHLSEVQLRRHNQQAALHELGTVHNAVRNGRLRELVEARVRAHPELTALLRRIDQESAHIEERAPVARHATIFANTKESLRRPEFVRFRGRVATRYRPDATAPILLLLPCSHRKPYGRSRTHRAIARAVDAAGARTLVHEVIVTSPLGLVPRELETTFPAAHYDVPVTGEWDEEEGAMIRALLSSLLAKRQYSRVVSHLPKHTYELVRSVLPESTRATCLGPDATRETETARLEETLRELGRGLRRTHPEMLRERVHGLASYQFGPEAAARLLEEAHVEGRWPVVKLLEGKRQIAMLPPERGLLSLTIEGGRRVASTGAYTVEIDDFPVKGSIFAVGVRDADPQIRVGDDVVVVHGGDVRAVGVAAMTGPEMKELERGEAVKMRHHA